MHPPSIKPVRLSNLTPSDSRSDLFRRTFSLAAPHSPAKPPIRPPEATTRCHGTRGANGLRLMAPPTARALPAPSEAATTPYDAT